MRIHLELAGALFLIATTCLVDGQVSAQTTTNANNCDVLGALVSENIKALASNLNICGDLSIVLRRRIAEHSNALNSLQATPGGPPMTGPGQAPQQTQRDLEGRRGS